jgi:hypothetical protein
LLDDYYNELGWDKQTGCPSKERVIAVGLEDIAEDLDRLGIWDNI